MYCYHLELQILILLFIAIIVNIRAISNYEKYNAVCMIRLVLLELYTDEFSIDKQSLCNWFTIRQYGVNNSIDPLIFNTCRVRLIPTEPP